MTRAENAEITAVNRQNSFDIQSLGNRHNYAVNKVNFSVGVSFENFRRSFKIGNFGFNNL